MTLCGGYPSLYRPVRQGECGEVIAGTMDGPVHCSKPLGHADDHGVSDAVRGERGARAQRVEPPMPDAQRARQDELDALVRRRFG